MSLLNSIQRKEQGVGNIYNESIYLSQSLLAADIFIFAFLIAAPSIPMFWNAEHVCFHT
jgi:hypothetical protein